MIALFFDTETNGIKSDDNPLFKPALVQLAAILQDLTSGRILGEINLISNLYPGVFIPADVIAIHDITNEMTVQFGIDPKLIDITFGKMVKMADVIVAHNIAFDLDIIKDNLPLTHSVIDFKHHFCTMMNNIYIVKQPLNGKPPGYAGMEIDPTTPYRVPSLTNTYNYYFGEDFDNAHDAMADTKAMRDIFLMMIANGWFYVGTDPEFPGSELVLPTDKLKQTIAAQ